MTNREIKFRAWDKEIDRMFDLGSVPAIISSTRELAPEEHWITCTDHVLMQYTGLKDKSGVDIYEGDIVKIWDRGWNCGGMGDKQINSLVEFKDGCFTNAFTRDAGGIEVIGNIYEHKHLTNAKL